MELENHTAESVVKETHQETEQCEWIRSLCFIAVVGVLVIEPKKSTVNGAMGCRMLLFFFVALVF